VRAHCLIYTPYSFNGQGPAASCAAIAAHFPQELTADMFMARTRTKLPENVCAREALPPLARRLPWRFVQAKSLDAVNRAFVRALHEHDPASTVIYVWPGAPLWVIRTARKLGYPIVREMINSACATSGPILDEAYRELKMAPAHTVTEEIIEEESIELQEYDFIFASNPEVESSLRQLGIPAGRILPTAFGWSPDRFSRTTTVPRVAHGVRVLFVGSIGVRKGIPHLLEAWREAGIDGELVLAGRVEPAIAALVDRQVGDGRVRLAGYVDDLGALYRSADMFVFPTIEEGGPQVTYEAAGCGLPIITTPMGAARLVENGRSGFVVDAGDRDQLVTAIRVLGTDAELRRRYGAAAQADAANFDYRHVGLARGRHLVDIAYRQQRARP
jgi:glycosyltransferase involved in cell wall biosynthesis